MSIQIVVAGMAGLALTTALAHTALAHTALAQSPVASPKPPAAVGTWRGTSRCLVRPSACNDEVVIYRITPTQAADSLAVDARKIVRGQEEEMGVLGCRLTPSSGRLTCTMPSGVWRFIVREDSLTGELRLRDDSRYREVRTARAASAARGR